MKFELAFLFALLASASASAQEVAAVAVDQPVLDPVTVIDFSNLATAIAPFVMILVAAVLFKGYQYLAAKTGLEKIVTEAQLKAALDKVMTEGTAYAISNIKDADWTKVETKHKALGFSINYVNDHAAELLEATGLDSAKLQQKLEAKLLPYDTAPGEWKE